MGFKNSKKAQKVILNAVNRGQRDSKGLGFKQKEMS